MIQVVNRIGEEVLGLSTMDVSRYVHAVCFYSQLTKDSGDQASAT